MAKRMTEREQVTQKREARYRLIQRASEGDEEALKLLAGAPHHLRVYTPKERETYIEEQKPQS